MIFLLAIVLRLILLIGWRDGVLPAPAPALPAPASALPALASTPSWRRASQTAETDPGGSRNYCSTFLDAESFLAALVASRKEWSESKLCWPFFELSDVSRLWDLQHLIKQHRCNSRVLACKRHKTFGTSALETHWSYLDG